MDGGENAREFNKPSQPDAQDAAERCEASVFISYQHADKALAGELQDGLEARGFFVWRDEGELRVGDSIVDRVTDALDRIDFVAALVSATSVESAWCQKELSLAMTGEIARRGVVVLPVRVDGTPMPASLADKLYVDVSTHDAAGAVDALARSIARHLAPPRPIPVRRQAPNPRPERPAPTAASEPIKVTGVVESEIGSPRNDGSSGSALYAVPLQLSRQASTAWGDFFVYQWDGMLFSTMHRPGIARVSGDRIILDGTTVAEVRDHHLTTVKTIVAWANDFERQRQTAAEAEQKRQADAEDAHRGSVRSTIEGMQFE